MTSSELIQKLQTQGLIVWNAEFYWWSGFFCIVYQNGFQGFACELCKDSNIFGSFCNESKCYQIHLCPGLMASIIVFLISTSYLAGLFDIFMLQLCFIFDRTECVLVTFYHWGHFVRLIMSNLDLISIQSWTYLTKFTICWTHTHFFILFVPCSSQGQDSLIFLAGGATCFHWNEFLYKKNFPPSILVKPGRQKSFSELVNFLGT